MPALEGLETLETLYIYVCMCMYLVLGSCRVLVTMSYSKYHCLNTFAVVGQRDVNPNKLIGRGWSINEHYEMIKLILGIKCKEDYIGHEYNYNVIEENVLYIRNAWTIQYKILY